MSNQAASLSKLGSEARQEHARVAREADLELGRRRFAQAAAGRASHRLSPPPRWLLFAAAALGTSMAAAAVGSVAIQQFRQPEPPAAEATEAGAAKPKSKPRASTILQPAREEAAQPAQPPTAAPVVPPVEPGPAAAPSVVASLAGPLSSLPPALQRERLLATRNGSPHSPKGSAAAFSLARLYADLLGNPREAATWFGVYLAEQPQGPLRGDARGRRLECLWQSGQKDAARREAKLYLAEYAGGPYAPQAQRILGP